ncbi:MAG: biopolymer transporter ExbD [Acaryochloris sp. RU_4_1]|nr:biopolymer transporter ExbD [Acaryochloris sp. RU_4_1]NJR53193.1 biopolymer transporter ExbD [Acaryochloris sp. CRU_2_0]
MKTYLESEEPDIHIELIPLVDVVFCLLAVLILGLVGLSRPEGINLNLPKAQTGTAQFSARFRVQVGILGELLANDQPVDPTQLKQLVSLYLRTQPDGVVILKADGGATYDQVITVLDLLRSVGGERVALETTKDNPTANPTPAPNQPSVPRQVPGQEPTLLPVPSVEDPASGTVPPSVPGQPSAPLPGQPQIPGLAPLPRGIPRSTPNVPPANPITP